MTGSWLAIQNAWFDNHYIQKGLTAFVLEIAAKRLVLSVLVAFSILALLGPGISLVAARVAPVANPRLRWIVLILGVVVWIVGGYCLNQSSWFPPFGSLRGILGNVVFSLLCLGLASELYRRALKLRQRVDARLPSRGLASALYSRSLLALLALCLVGFVGFACFKVSALKPQGPNVVILTIDTLRADHLGCYGYPRETSPTIDSLAADGIRFEHVYATRGMTWPSLTSMMTSLYPKTHGVRDNQVPLEGQYLTLAEVLKNAGYRTGAFLANYYYAPNRGFDVKKGDEVGDLDRIVTRQAVEWLDGIDPKRDRFFLWLHQKNPHIPYQPPARILELFERDYTGPYNGDGAMTDAVFVDRIDLAERDLSHLMALYDGEIRSSDTNMQDVLAKLREKGLEKDTLIVFTADHGEELYDHNKYFYHQCSIYDSVLRIPLIFKLPGALAAGKVVGDQIQNVDVAPTILQLLKLPVPKSFEGRSFMPLLFGMGGDEARPAFAERTERIYSIRTPEWKYIYNPENLTPECLKRRGNESTPYVIQKEELYRVREDPGEKRNVVADNPEVARDLRTRLVEWVETDKRVHKEHQLTKDELERLRALGYVN